MSQYQISKKRLAEIIKEEYANLHEYVDPRTPDPPAWKHDDAGSSFRRQVMNLVLNGVDKAVEPGKKEKLINDIELALAAAGIGGPISTVANRKDEAKHAKKDYDGDGEVESSTEEWKGSRDKAIKKNKREEDEDLEESLSTLRDLIKAELKSL
jgi:hypothetical protein